MIGIIGGDVDLNVPSGILESGVESFSIQPSEVDAGLYVVNNSRLFDRRALIVLLGCPGLNSKTASDSQLILHAYRKWSADCVLRLSGEFSFVIWDPKKRVLFCARDHVASRPFYYFFHKGRFVFGTDPERLSIRTSALRRPNLRKIAVLGLPGGKSQLNDETFHEDILALPAGTSMVVNARGITRRKYWEIEMDSADVPRSPTEAFEALRQIIFDSVRERISDVPRVGALLSGGLDSSSVVAVAAGLVADRGESIHSFAGVLNERETSFGDEREFVSEFAARPGVRLTYVTPPSGAGPFDSIDDPSRFARTFVVTSRYYVYAALQAAAQEQNVQLLLDGCGGECGPTAHNRVYFLEMAVRGRWSQLRRDLKSLQKTDGVSPARELCGHLLNILAPARREHPSLLLNPRFVREFSCQPSPPRRPWPNHRRVQMYRVRDYLARRASNIGAARAIPHSYPLLDRRILEFCISAPGRLKIGGGYYRLLIRKAMDGVLPPKIQWRTSKTPFSPDYPARYNRQVEYARQWLAQIRPNDPVAEIVDLNALRTHLRPLRAGESFLHAESTVPATIYLINFLRQFPGFAL